MTQMKHNEDILIKVCFILILITWLAHLYHDILILRTDIFYLLLFS